MIVISNLKPNGEFSANHYLEPLFVFRLGTQNTIFKTRMAITVFKDISYTLSTLLEEIDRGEIALPDIQRPFVWKPAKVRDLFDSMYHGFPVGNLLFWETGAEMGARRIGTHAHEAAPRLMIVDGQQRLTGLYSVLMGKKVLRKDYTSSRIRIAFRPRDGSFEVADAAVVKNPEFIPDVSILWDGNSQFKRVHEFLERLEAGKGPLKKRQRHNLEEAISRLYNLCNYPFRVLALEPNVDEEKVADLFVRINSEGVRLSPADFILTLMSVWWEEGRKQLEAFARTSKLHPPGPSPANPFIDPSADQMLRVVAGLALGRGRLRYVYQVLRGKDLKTGEISAEIREKQFAALQEAQARTLSLTNWHEFLKAVRRAGYRGRAMISSENNLLFSYLIYLIAHRDFGLDRKTLREAIAQWFFMTSLTGRYTGTFESQVERDLRRIAESKSSDEFVATLNGIIDTALTADYWTIRLPSSLETSSAYGPTVFAYQASLVLLNAQPLFSPLQLGELLDPSTHAPRSAVERHHLFPKAYLTRIGIEHTVQRNQIANYAFIEWPDNVKIGDLPPSEYFSPLFKELTQQQQNRARFWHALPDGWEEMEYKDFLQERRVLIADVIRAAFNKLRTGQLPEENESLSPSAGLPKWSVKDLIAGMETDKVEFKSSAYYSYKVDVPERVITESVLKTIAGFLNASGGTLAVGIADDGEILGIQPDLDKKNMDEDRYVNSLTNAIERSLGQLASTMAKIQLQAIDGVQVALVHVAPSPEPIYAKISKRDRAFFVRVNNSTRILEGGDLVGYVKQRWA